MNEDRRTGTSNERWRCRLWRGGFGSERKSDRARKRKRASEGWRRRVSGVERKKKLRDRERGGGGREGGRE